MESMGRPVRRRWDVSTERSRLEGSVCVSVCVHARTSAPPTLHPPLLSDQLHFDRPLEHLSGQVALLQPAAAALAALSALAATAPLAAAAALAAAAPFRMRLRRAVGSHGGRGGGGGGVSARGVSAGGDGSRGPAPRHGDRNSNLVGGTVALPLRTHRARTVA